MTEDTLKEYCIYGDYDGLSRKKNFNYRSKENNKKIFQTEQRPDKNITLNFEHNISLVALKNLQKALIIFYGQLFEFTKGSFLKII